MTCCPPPPNTHVVSENSCAVNNGGCDVLCLTVPSIGDGTEPQCACPTGILFSPDGDTCLPCKLKLAVSLTTALIDWRVYYFNTHVWTQ